jgi:hypothetical protein
MDVPLHTVSKIYAFLGLFLKRRKGQKISENCVTYHMNVFQSCWILFLKFLHTYYINVVIIQFKTNQFYFFRFQEMAINSYDIVSTLQALGMMKYWKGKHIILKKQVCKILNLIVQKVRVMIQKI